MEFNNDKTIIYPLRLKDDTINELSEHMALCYVGKSHFSAEQHAHQESTFMENEEEIVKIQEEHKKIAIKIRDALLTNELEDVGRYLDESWKNKKKLSGSMSNPKIDLLYETGLKNGWLTINEVRGEQNLPDVEGGDVGGEEPPVDDMGAEAPPMSSDPMMHETQEEELDESGTYTSTDGMDRIENAIEEALG